MKFGLALSGGGYRATVFHLGVLARLAESKKMEDVSFVSTVSGGSLCAGLLFGRNGLQWPGSEAYLDRVLPDIRELLTTQDLQSEMIIRSLLHPLQLFQSRAADLSALMQKRWGITAPLSELPKSPRWMINATCYETGKDWRFERFRAGDYVFGYTYDTQEIPITDAMAASAGFPGLVGPLVFETQGLRWFKYKDRRESAVESQEEAVHRKTRPVKPLFTPVHLWDGGVYDNHGLEGLHDFISGWRMDVDFLLVSDGAGRSGPSAYRPGSQALLRIISGIMMDQIRSLRSRAVIERLVNHHDSGSFLQIGNTTRDILTAAGKAEEAGKLAPGCLSDDETFLVQTMPTVIKKLQDFEFERIFRHGFEVADATLYAYHPDQFSWSGYANSRASKHVREAA